MRCFLIATALAASLIVTIYSGVIKNLIQLPDNIDVTISKSNINKAVEKSSSVVLQTSNNMAMMSSAPTRQSLFCQPRKREGLGSISPAGRAPLIVWAKSRTGSYLLLDFLHIINNQTSEEEFDVFDYDEYYHFQPRKELQVQQHGEDIRKSCEEGDDVEWRQEQANNLQIRGQKNPVGLMKSLSDIPSWSKRGYYILKIFMHHLKKTHTSEANLVNALNEQLGGIPKPKHIILWRRRMIESIVSGEVAMVTGDWWKNKVNRSEEEPIRVTLNQKDLRQYTKKVKEYYTKIRDALRSSNSDYMILEYGKDLLDASVHPQTIQKLIDFFELGPVKIDLQQNQHREKQAKIPIHEQVTNWNKVVEWGFGGETDEWPDIFAD